MKLEIDTKEKTIIILEPVTIKELVKDLTEDTMEFTIISKVNIWNIPYTIPYYNTNPYDPKVTWVNLYNSNA